MLTLVSFAATEMMGSSPAHLLARMVQEDAATEVPGVEAEAAAGGKRAGLLSLCRQACITKKYCILIYVLLLILVAQLLQLAAIMLRSILPDDFSESAMAESIRSAMCRALQNLNVTDESKCV